MIDITTVRFLSGSGRILLKEDGSGFESVGLAHRLKSFFNIGDARERNRETLAAIRAAVVSNPSFFGAEDLQYQAGRLLDDVRTDRAIDSSRIVGIVLKMDHLTARDDDTLDKRVDMHLAVSELPDELKGCASDVAFISKLRVREANVIAGPVKRANVTGIISNIIHRCSYAIRSLSEMPDGHSKKLDAFARTNLRKLMLNGDGSQRTDQEIADICQFCRNASIAAYRRGRELYGEAGAAGEIERVAEFEVAAAEFAVSAGKHATPALLDKINGYVKQLPLRDFTRLIDGRSTDSQIRAMLRNLSGQMPANPFRNEDGTHMLGGDARATEALARYISKLMELSLPGSSCAVICDRMQVPSAGNVFQNLISEAIKA